MLNDKMLSIARPQLGVKEVLAAGRAILSGWVTQGPEVVSFEKEFASFTGASYACAVSSCTAALHMALLAVGVNPGDEVVTVSHSFIATANSVRYCGATPVFVDIEPLSYNLDIEKIEAAITEKTSAILCVHQMGMPCDIKRILEVAKRHAIPVVEDAACAIGSEIFVQNEWEKIGKPHGDIACFSFHPRKIITTGDGGMLTTSNPVYDKKFRLLRQHGMSVSDKERHESDRVIFEVYDELGYNYRMTDIQAAIGREQLLRLPGILKKRRALAFRYHKLLQGVSGLVLPEDPGWARSNWQSYCVRLPAGAVQLDIMEKLLKLGVSSRRGVMCAHRQKVYEGQSFSLPESEKATDGCIILPLFPQMKEKEQDKVCLAIKNMKWGKDNG